MNPQLLLDLLDRALIEELGLVVDTPNPKALELRLHDIRKGRPEYATIQISVPSTPNTIMLVKKSVELNELVWDEPGDLPDV